MNLQSHLCDTVLHGRRVRYLDIGDGPTLLLVHGLGASWRTWAENVGDLARDHRVIAVDLPGFGRSQTLSGPADMAQLAEVLAGVLRRVGVERATVVGHSLGGLVALRFALCHPERVSGLVLVASGSRRLSARQALAFQGLAVSSAVLSRMGPLALFATPAFSVAMMVGPVRRRVVAQAVHDPASFPARYVAEMLTGATFSPGFRGAMRAAMRPGLWDDIERIETRTLIFAGSSDRIIPTWVAEDVTNRMPYASLEIWDDVGHHPMLEQPERFNERLRAFVAQGEP